MTWLEIVLLILGITIGPLFFHSLSFSEPPIYVYKRWWDVYRKWRQQMKEDRRG
ncbi:hypothetical protein [Brevibacillus formosus]|uniref:hypothetical protein n=1 Tax=Brevibacillus formosus TaxID=54913 RepID=UPI003F1E06A2